MNYVYVLRSLKTGKRYIGSTAKDPSERLKQHNAGMSQWTKTQRPFELIYTEPFVELSIAEKREKFFKTGKGFQVLNSLLKERLPSSPTTTLGDPPKP
jgi:putative endonuclease